MERIRAALTDPLAVAFWIAAVGVACADAFGPKPTSWFPFLAHAPFLVLAATATWQAARRAQTPAGERFWALWTGALGAWLLEATLAFSLPFEIAGSTAASLGSDILFVAFYTLAALAVEAAPRSDEPKTGGTSLGARVVSTSIFIGGAAVYFIVLPTALGSDWYDTWIPSLLLYIALDLYLIVRFVRLRLKSSRGSWRDTYGWCIAAAGTWVVADAWSILTTLGLLPEGPSLLWNLIGVPAFAFMLIAARVREAKRSTLEPIDAPTAGRPNPDRSGGRLLAYAVAVTAAHFLLSATSALDPQLRGARDICVLTLLGLLALLSWTHQRRIHSQVDRLRSERDALNQRMELAQRMEAVGRLAGGIAHDFNNSLQLIGTHADLLLLENGERERDHAEGIRAAVRRAGRLTDKLLTMSRRRQANPTRFDLNQVPRALAPLASKAVGEGSECVLELAPEPLWIDADKDLLEHAALNLLLNARDALETSGSIRMATFRHEGADGPTCVLSVQDTGVGMLPGVLERAFEPFFTTKGERGTGLGLSMVYGIVTQCGGSVRVDSAPQKGTRVELALPAAQAPEKFADQTPTPEARDTANGRSIMVVEDERPILKVIRMHLTALGYEVRTATDGPSALRALEERAADVVLTDVAMPGMSGVDLMEQLALKTPETSVVFMSGYAESVLDGTPAAALSVPLLRKPFTAEELDACLREAMPGS